MSDLSLVRDSRFFTNLSRALSNRGKELLEARDLPERVSALAPLTAYFIVKELGVDDATPILRHCSSEQLQTFVDLDCWDADRPDADDIDAWLAPFLAEGVEVLTEAFLRLDQELQVWFLSNSIDVFDAGDENLPEPPRGVTRKNTPDTYYQVQQKTGLDREVPPVVLVEALYAHDLNTAFRLLTAARWETPSPLEERAFRFRNARLESLGFASRAVALSLFANPKSGEREPLAVPPSRGDSQLPALYAAPLFETSLLARALGKIADEAWLDHLADSLRLLINHAIIAYGNSPRDVQHAAQVAGRVRDTVSLGLEDLLSPDAPLAQPDNPEDAMAAAQLLRCWTLFDLFRRGHSLVKEAQAQAQLIASEPAVAAWRATPLDEKSDYGRERQWRELLDALLEFPPLYGGFDPVRPVSRRAFAAKGQIEQAQAQLDEIARTIG